MHIIIFVLEKVKSKCTDFYFGEDAIILHKEKEILFPEINRGGGTKYVLKFGKLFFTHF